MKISKFDPKSKVNTSDLIFKPLNIQDLNTLLQFPCFNIKKNDDAKLRRGFNKKEEMASAKLVFQPCKIQGGLDTSDESYTYSYYKSKKQEICDSGAIRENTDITLNRVDICIDLEQELKELMPILNILADVYRMRYNVKDKNDIVYYSSFCTSPNNVLGRLVKTDQYELDIYDKAYESNGSYPYSTRIEFRYKQTAKTFRSCNNEEHIIKHLLKFLDSEKLEEDIDKAVELRADKLYRDYVENSRKHKLDLKSFTLTYLDKVGCREVLEAVYNKLGMKNFKEWLKSFKRSTNVKIYGKKDLLKLIKSANKSVKKYLKS